MLALKVNGKSIEIATRAEKARMQWTKEEDWHAIACGGAYLYTGGWSRGDLFRVSGFEQEGTIDFAIPCDAPEAREQGKGAAWRCVSFYPKDGGARFLYDREAWERIDLLLGAFLMEYVDACQGRAIVKDAAWDEDVVNLCAAIEWRNARGESRRMPQIQRAQSA